MAELLRNQELQRRLPADRLRGRSVDIYHLETLRPIVCLAFVTPVLLTYELGVVFSDSSLIRNGVDTGFQWALQLLGIGQLLVLPLLTIFVLIGMHHRRGDRAGFRLNTLGGMLLESAGLGLILLCAARAHHLWFLEVSDDLLLAIPGEPTAAPSRLTLAWQSFVSFCGAGLYEELLFRLLLLSGLVFGLRRIGLGRFMAIVVSMLLTSGLFAAAHYQIINPVGTEFDLPSFAVRFVASLFFCGVFLLRGFGIAVGTHIAYDMLAQL